MYIAHQLANSAIALHAAAIPMHTPQVRNFIHELEYAVKELGLKVVVMTQHVPRPIAGDRADFRRDAQRGHVGWRFRVSIVLTDYDAVWAKCVELGVMPSFHAGTRALISHLPTNFVFNPHGHFAVAGEAVAKGLSLGV